MFDWIITVKRINNPVWFGSENTKENHMKIHKKDNSSRRGLIAMVNKRRKLLNYLQREDHARYSALVNSLKLRR